MALMQLTYQSQALQRNVSLQVILPTPKWTQDGKLMPPKKFKTLYLLQVIGATAPIGYPVHGSSGGQKNGVCAL